MLPLAKQACRLISEKQSFVLAIIISQQGSTPRAAGTLMLVSADGIGYGTIGGGFMEARVMSEAIEALAEDRARIISMELTQHDAAISDMICGGRLEILLSPIRPEKSTAAVFNEWRKALADGVNAIFLTVLRESDGRIVQTEHCLLKTDGSLIGKCLLSTDDLKHVIQAVKQPSVVTLVALKHVRVVALSALRLTTLYLFGAGHVGLQTARMAALVDFKVIVLDDRKAFANLERFPDAHEVRVLTDFDQAFADIAVDEDSFVVIVTRGHLYDQTVLRQALQTRAGYIGMIGSRKKRDQIFNDLRQQGFSKTDIGRVYSPIGLNIGAETPAEIAVSIVAEMIRVRSEKT